jgi:hypothetical protein
LERLAGRNRTPHFVEVGRDGSIHEARRCKLALQDFCVEAADSVEAADNVEVDGGTADAAPATVSDEGPAGGEIAGTVEATDRAEVSGSVEVAV